MASGKPVSGIKPIMLYDHLPGILAGYPAVLFLLLGLLALPSYLKKGTDVEVNNLIAQLNTSVSESTENSTTISENAAGIINELESSVLPPDWAPNGHMLFWIGLSIMVVWYIAFRFNMPKSKFWLMFGLMGTFVGIPVVLEITQFITPFSWAGKVLGSLAPEVNAGAFFALSLVFFVIWLGNFVWSRTHMRVRIDESGLTINRLGGKGERFELIGLKTENEPLDYLELFIAGVGSLSLKTRMNKPIFEMKRVVGLYRTPLFPFFRGKLARVEEILSYQGKVVSVDKQDAVDAADMADAAGDEDHIHEADEQVSGGGEAYDGDVGTLDSGGSEMN